MVLNPASKKRPRSSCFECPVCDLSRRKLYRLRDAWVDFVLEVETPPVIFPESRSHGPTICPIHRASHLPRSMDPWSPLVDPWIPIEFEILHIFHDIDFPDIQKRFSAGDALHTPPGSDTWYPTPPPLTSSSDTSGANLVDLATEESYPETAPRTERVQAWADRVVAQS